MSKDENIDELVRCSISLPQILLKQIDSMISDNSSRSEFIRDLVRERMVNDEWADKDKELMGVLTIIYNHHQSDLVVKKMRLEHDANVEIFCTTHVHLSHHYCLEVLIIKGKGELIEKFSANIAGLKGVKFSGLTKTALLEE